jgi:hypothetical protein
MSQWFSLTVGLLTLKFLRSQQRHGQIDQQQQRDCQDDHRSDAHEFTLTSRTRARTPAREEKKESLRQ